MSETDKVRAEKQAILSLPPDGRGYTWRMCKCGQLHMAPEEECNTLCPWCMPKGRKGSEMGSISHEKVEVCQVDTYVRVTKDGDAICALLGDNLQEGQAGFGRTVSEALHNLAHQLQRQPVPWGPSDPDPAPEVNVAVDEWLTHCEGLEGRLVVMDCRALELVAAARAELTARAGRKSGGWQETARQYSRNSDYWRGRAEKAEAKLAARGDERVVEVDSTGWECEGKRANVAGMGSGAEAFLRHVFRGERCAIRRLPDEPAPVEEKVRPVRCRPGWVLCPKCYQLQRDNTTYHGRCCEACRIPFGAPRPLPESEEATDDD